MKLRVVDQVGPNCLTIADGQSIYEAVRAQLLEGGSVELDFDGVEVIASPFFNAAVGQLLSEIPERELRGRLSFAFLSDVGVHVLERVIANAAQYYSKPDMQRAIDEILNGGEDV